jgi:DNA-binding NtrC family response regulator
MSVQSVRPEAIEAARAAFAALHRDAAQSVGDAFAQVEAPSDASPVDEILGESPAICRLRALVARAAGSDASVLVTGESGTGKELVACALHRAGRRAHGPFVAMNCAAVPEALLESELFGHVRGAFTDAKAARQGLFAEADGGTLFLDEIGDMSLALQPKLLRALQERTVRPVGGATEIPFDARIIAATNEDVAALVAMRRFRRDLYYRLDVIHVEVPPLRERGDDVALLAHAFARTYAEKHDKRVTGISDEAMERLRRYPWPGNVRELQNCIERAVALCEGAEITVDDLSQTVSSSERPPPPAPDDDVLVSLAEIERRHILRVLEAVSGNKRLAARILGLDRRTLYRRLEQYAEIRR